MSWSGFNSVTFAVGGKKSEIDLVYVLNACLLFSMVLQCALKMTLFDSEVIADSTTRVFLI